jgi:hypothetical protein
MKFNVKKVTIIMVIIMIGSFMIAAGIFYSTGGTTIKTAGSQDIDERASFDAGKISAIKVNSISSNVTLKTSDKIDSNVIDVHFYGTAIVNLKSSKPALDAKIIGDELDIQLLYPVNLNIFGIYSNDTKIDITIPKNYSQSIKKLDIKTTDANVSINEFSVGEFNFNTVSGNLKTESFTSEKYMIKSTSGDVNMINYIGEVTAETISGDVYLAHQFQHDLEGGLNIRTISGNVSLKLPQNSEFYLNLNSISGILSNEFPVKLINSGKNNIEGTVTSEKYKVIVKTTSGNIGLFY